MAHRIIEAAGTTPHFVQFFPPFLSFFRQQNTDEYPGSVWLNGKC